jgi:hypothetical protein
MARVSVGEVALLMSNVQVTTPVPLGLYIVCRSWMPKKVLVSLEVIIPPIASGGSATVSSRKSGTAVLGREKTPHTLRLPGGSVAGAIAKLVR